MGGWLYDAGDNGIVSFIVLTLILGGAGAIASGRAVAGQWRGFAILPFYMILLSAAVRFLHYALLGEDLFSIPGYIVALVWTMVCTFYGYRSRRAEQMSVQYSWLYAKAGPLGWKSKAS